MTSCQTDLKAENLSQEQTSRCGTPSNWPRCKGRPEYKFSKWPKTCKRLVIWRILTCPRKARLYEEWKREASCVRTVQLGPQTWESWKSRRQKDQRVGWLLWGDRRPLNWWCILPSSWRLFSIYETKRSQLRLRWLSKSQRRSRWARSVHAFSTLVLPKIWNLCFPIQRKHWRYWRKNSRALKKNLSNLKRNSWYYGDIHNTAT